MAQAVTEVEFKETVDIIKAANLMKAKGVVERMFQENLELRAQLTAAGITIAEKEREAKRGSKSSSNE